MRIFFKILQVEYKEMEDPTSHIQDEELRVSEGAATSVPIENKEKEKMEREKKEREEEKKKKVTPEPDIEDESENDDPTGKLPLHKIA